MRRGKSPRMACPRCGRDVAWSPWDYQQTSGLRRLRRHKMPGDGPLCLEQFADPPRSS